MNKQLTAHLDGRLQKHPPRFTIAKDCTFERAVTQGFGGTPERWEEIKREYVERVLEKNGEGVQIDYTNILLGSRDMQDGDGDWHHFPE